MKTYTSEELTKFTEHIERARNLWADAARTEFQKSGDAGSCVIGAGLECYVLPPRCKHPRSYQLISFNLVSPCQGEHAASVTAKVAVGYLQSVGLETRYNYGRMD